MTRAELLQAPDTPANMSYCTQSEREQHHENKAALTIYRYVPVSAVGSCPALRTDMPKSAILARWSRVKRILEGFKSL